MRQHRLAGEKLFIDCTGPTVPLVNGARAQVFVSAMDASSYVFACATPAQRLDDWIERMVRAPSFYSVCRVVLDFVAGNKIRHDVAHGSAEVAKRLLVQLRPSLRPDFHTMNRPGIELTPRSWTNFKGFHEEVPNRVQARGRQELFGDRRQLSWPRAH
jgi:hypothetical protein